MKNDSRSSFLFVLAISEDPTIYFLAKLWKEPSLEILLQSGTSLGTAFRERKNRTGGHTRIWNSHGFLSFIEAAPDTSAVKCRKSNSSGIWEGNDTPKYTLYFSLLILKTTLFLFFVLLSEFETYCHHQQAEHWNSVSWPQRNHSLPRVIRVSIWKQNPIKETF